MAWAQELQAELNKLGAGIEHIWIADTEFYGADGDLPVPVCAVFFNPLTGQAIRQWYEPGDTPQPQFHSTIQLCLSRLRLRLS